ncbi:MAG: transcription elongation factor GreA [Thermoleophilia bacterium]
MPHKEEILTEEGLKELQEKIEHLSTVKREEVAERIRQAREFGDISENSEYDDAKNEQAMLENQISKLQERLRRARVIKPSEVTGDRVAVGTRVVLRDIETDETFTYTIVGSSEADPAKQRLSNESPLGQAIIGRSTGDKVNVPAPAGNIEYEIVSIEGNV